MKRKLLAFVLCAAAASPAAAWGDREQGMLAGAVLGAVIASQMNVPNHFPAPAPRVVLPGVDIHVHNGGMIPHRGFVPGPRWRGHHGPRCALEPVYTANGVPAGYREVCY